MLLPSQIVENGQIFGQQNSGFWQFLRYFLTRKLFESKNMTSGPSTCKFQGILANFIQFCSFSMVNILARIAYLCPSPKIQRMLFLPCFSQLFLWFFGVGGACFAVKPRNYLKTARSTEILKELDLKCLKLSKIGLKLHISLFSRENFRQLGLEKLLIYAPRGGGGYGRINHHWSFFINFWQFLACFCSESSQCVPILDELGVV